MLHRALQQFLADVYWGDLDVLLLGPAAGHRRRRDLGGSADPERRDPGGDDTADGGRRGGRAGGCIALQTRQRIVGVVENMSGLLMPDGSTMQLFGEGGGRSGRRAAVARRGADVPLLGQIPLDPALVTAGDSGRSAGTQRPRLACRQGVAKRGRQLVGPPSRAGRHVAGHRHRSALTSLRDCVRGPHCAARNAISAQRLGRVGVEGGWAACRFGLGRRACRAAGRPASRTCR